MKLLSISDLEFQENFVRTNAWRLLALQDQNPASPSYGCFHLAYWRDKTSEFPDARFQEAGAALALLALLNESSSDPILSPLSLLKSFEASVLFWSRIQNSNGSFDEWYKNENGFAATEFTLIAMGLAVHALGSRLSVETRHIYQATAKRAAVWLSKRNDFVKLNHQMAAAAALAITATNLQDSSLFEFAKQKHESVIRQQTSEGWFNEINGMDLGYCSVLFDYSQLYRRFSEDCSGDSAMSKLFDFLDNHLLPNFTVMPEMGLCLNPYVSRLGVVLGSSHIEKCSRWYRWLSQHSNGNLGLVPYLGDDLRLCRWAYLPLVAQIYRRDTKPVAVEERPMSVQQFVFFNRSLVGSWRKGFYSAYFSCVSGGGLKLCSNLSQGSFSTLEDQGYLVRVGGQYFSTQGYDPARTCVISEERIEQTLKLGKCRFVFPGFFSRLALRILTELPGGPVVLRKIIDLYRRINRTALNQSAAPVANRNSPIEIHREIHFFQDSLRIVDQIDLSEGLSVSEIELISLLKTDENDSFRSVSLNSSKVKVNKFIKFENAQPPLFSFEVL